MKNTKKIFLSLLSVFIIISLPSCSSALNKLKNLDTEKQTYEENKTYNKIENTTPYKESIPKPSEETKTVGKVIQTKVTGLYDGDTFYVGAFNTRIRLIGVDCPEAGTTTGERATQFTNAKIPVGTTVWIEQDVELYDKYGRPLMYVWLSNPGSAVTYNDVKTKMLNGILVANGHAVAKDYPPNTKYASWFHQI